MVREVTHEAEGPYIVTPDDIDEEKGDVAICLCGLSDDYPFCDGSHRRTEDEVEGVRYKYVDGERRRVRVEFVDGRADGDRDGSGTRDDDGAVSANDDRAVTGDEDRPGTDDR